MATWLDLGTILPTTADWLDYPVFSPDAVTHRLTFLNADNGAYWWTSYALIRPYWEILDPISEQIIETPGPTIKVWPETSPQLRFLELPEDLRKNELYDRKIQLKKGWNYRYRRPGEPTWSLKIEALQLPIGNIAKIEAENLNALGFYEIQAGLGVRLGPNPNEGDFYEISYNTSALDGIETGTYDLFCAYFDENDGTDAYFAYVNNYLIDSWTSSLASSSAFPEESNRVNRRIAQEIYLKAGTEIRIRVEWLEGNDRARIDYLEFERKG